MKNINENWLFYVNVIYFFVVCWILLMWIEFVNWNFVVCVCKINIFGILIVMWIKINIEDILSYGLINGYVYLNI